MTERDWLGGTVDTVFQGPPTGSGGPAPRRTLEEDFHYSRIALDLGLSEQRELLDPKNERFNPKKTLESIRERAKGLVPYSYEWSVLQIVGQTLFQDFDLDTLLRDPQKTYEYRPIHEWHQLPETFDRRAMAMVATRGESLQYNQQILQRSDPLTLASILAGQYPGSAPGPMPGAPSPSGLPSPPAGSGPPAASTPNPSPRSVPRVPVLAAPPTPRTPPRSRPSGPTPITTFGESILIATNDWVRNFHTTFHGTSNAPSAWKDYWNAPGQPYDRYMNMNVFNIGIARIQSFNNNGEFGAGAIVQHTLDNNRARSTRESVVSTYKVSSASGPIAFQQPGQGASQAHRNYVQAIRQNFQSERPNAKLVFMPLPHWVDYLNVGDAANAYNFYQQQYMSYAQFAVTNQAYAYLKEGYKLRFSVQALEVPKSDGSKETAYVIFPVLFKKDDQGNETIVPFAFIHNQKQANALGGQSLWGYLFTKEQVQSGNGPLTALASYFGISPDQLPVDPNSPLKRVQGLASRLNDWLESQERANAIVFPLLHADLVSINPLATGGI